MKKQYLKLVLTVISFLAAGICYSCSRQFPGQTVEETAEVLYLETDGWNNMEADSTSKETVHTAVLPQKTEETLTAEPVDGAEIIPETAAGCYVHICGAVVRPGVYELEQGERIFQAVERAGGFTEEAAEEYLNLALEVEDGMKIVVPSKAEAEAWMRDSGVRAAGEGAAGVAADAGRSAGAAVGTAGSGIGGVFMDTQPTVVEDAQGKVNLNTATKAELMTLSGIGEARAEDIIRYRETKGPFSRIEDIKKVSGIKDAAFQKIKDDITV